jgi:hypothetical protein
MNILSTLIQRLASFWGDREKKTHCPEASNEANSACMAGAVNDMINQQDAEDDEYIYYVPVYYPSVVLPDSSPNVILQGPD